MPLDTGTFPCGNSTSGYLLTTHYDGSTVGGIAFGGTRPSQPSDVIPDAAGNLYVSGSFEQQMTYGTLQPDESAGEDDGFLMKLGPDLTRAWIVTAGGLGHDRGGRLARVSGGTLWTPLVSRGARIGATIFPDGGQVVALIADSGAVTWARTVPDAHGIAPLGVTAAGDGSFALFGDGYLGLYSAAGVLGWERFEADARGAAFTNNSLVVAASQIGTQVFDATVATSGDDVPRAAIVAFPR